MYRLDHNKREAVKGAKGAKLPIGSLAPCDAPGVALVDIIAYCLNPNHFHFILKQLVDEGISLFVHKLGTSYTNYFNHKHKRTGSLFAGTYKAVSIESDEQLVYTSGYVNGNHEIHKLGKAENWEYGSYLDYIGKRNGQLTKRDTILNQFKGSETYREFVDSVIINAREIKEEIKRCFID